MLAAKNVIMDKIIFPVMATPKIDGIRCLVVKGQALTRSFKPIPNNHIRTSIEAVCPDGFDGEIVCGKTFQDVQSMVMSEDGEPEFQYLVFDSVRDINLTYAERQIHLAEDFSHSDIIKIAKPLYAETANNLEQLNKIMDRHLEQGHEGTMIRSPSSPYKCGRATLKEGYLTAIKPFVDGEATVIGFEERMHNTNAPTLDAFGRTERSTHKDNMVPMDTLGAFICRDDAGNVFNLGTGKGLTDELRKEIWDNMGKYIGRNVHYRYQKHGSLDKPRIPIWHGFRDPKDMS